jgi:hypothetical protein
MLCALCKLREATKKNTHYLTDSIIRSCLNQDGSKDREKGLYFDLSSTTPFVDFNFQRATSVTQVGEALGREPSEAEIEAAVKIPFSVDDVFCGICEATFTTIESAFSAKILPRLRGADLSNTDRVVLVDTKLARLFFYLQIWRTSVSTNVVQLSPATAEALRQLILNHEQVTAEGLKRFPLAVTYLETMGGALEYTTNSVGYTNHTNPNLILMNDFVIQFYEDADSISWFDFYGLNDTANFLEFVNYQEGQFIVRVMHDQERKQFMRVMHDTEKGNRVMEAVQQIFVHGWNLAFKQPPPAQIQDEFLKRFALQDVPLGVKYTKEFVLNSVVDFVGEYAENL